MKIAVIGAKGLPARQGGIEHQCAEVYPRMVERGHSVDLFARSSYTDSRWMQPYDFKGVRVVALPSIQLKGMDAFFTSALGAIASTREHYDVVHFHALGPSLFTWLPRIATSSKIIVTCQGLDWQRAKWGKLSSRLIRMGESAAVRFAHEMIVVSEELRSYFQQTYGRETVYIPNAPASYAESDPRFAFGSSIGLSQGQYIIYLGRLVPEKRPELLIEAFQALKPQGWKLVLAGGTSDTGPFTSKLAEMAVGNPDVVFAGELRGARLAEIVRGAGLFALPSDLEGLPLAMLEAMREGIPVLASDIPPHRQLLTEGRGILFHSGDVDACVRSLDWAIRHPQEVAAMAKSARKHVETNYNWDRITSENLKLYTTPSDTPHTLRPSNHRLNRIGDLGRKSALSTGPKANTFEF